MTPEAQRIAIAEACGWTIPVNWVQGGIWIRPDKAAIAHQGAGFTIPCPDYLNDLNAMHEAEKVLLNSGKSGIWTTYLYWLEVICDVPMHHATSSQRAEAFRRTLNL